MKPITEILVLSILSITTAYAVDAASTDHVGTLITLLDKFGVAVVILLYFVVRDYLRWKEDRERDKLHHDKIEELEKFIKTNLMNTLSRSNVCIDKNSRALNKIVHALKGEFPEIAHALERNTDE